MFKLRNLVEIATKFKFEKYDKCKNKKNGRNLCKKNDCYFCYYLSFASHPKSKYWHNGKNNGKIPRDVALNSHDKFWFKCSDCNHDFKSALSKINDERWCPHCSKNQFSLCDDENCDICFNNSFASHSKSKIWNYEKNNGKLPRNVTLKTGEKYSFKCPDCNHDFDSIPLIVINSKKYGCSYCVNQKRCDDEICDLCFEHSFASHPKSKYWNNKKNNGKTPRDVALNDNNKFCFTCSDCNHDFDSTLNNINNAEKYRCPYCVNRKRCDDENCDFCFKHSFASHQKSKYWNNEKNDGITPRDVALNSHDKFWFTCQDCNHNFDSALYHINTGKWCPYCSTCKREKEIKKWLLSMYITIPSFNKRPDFLKNPKTNFNLELDIWYESYNFAIEIQGIQHFNFLPYFHKSIEDYNYQIEKDKFKLEKCIENNINLLYINYDDDNYIETIQSYLKNNNINLL